MQFLINDSLIQINNDYLAVREHLDQTFSIIIVIFAIIGNSLIIIIMLNKQLTKLPISIYLLSLAISDTCVLLFDNFIIWIDLMLYKLSKNTIQKLTECKIYYIHYTAAVVSAWLIVSISMDRCLSVIYPTNYRVKVFLSKKSVIIRVIILILLAILINLNYLIQIKSPDSARDECFASGSNQVWSRYIWPRLFTFIYSIIPSILLIVFNTLIINKAKNSRINVATNSFKTISSSNKGHLNKTIFTLCMSYVLMTLPPNIFHIINADVIESSDFDSFNGTFNKQSDIDEFNHKQKIVLIARILELFMNSYHAVNFFLYILTSKTFRDQFFLLFNRNIVHIRSCFKRA